MATLYVENIPDDLYSALRARARRNRKSIAAEVLSLLEQNIPTATELRRRQKLVKQLTRIRSAPSPKPRSACQQRNNDSRGPRALTDLVLDASVAVKWCLLAKDEPFAEQAEVLLEKIQPRGSPVSCAGSVLGRDRQHALEGRAQCATVGRTGERCAGDGRSTWHTDRFVD